MNKKYFSYSLLTATLLCVSPFSFAKTLSLYDQPQANAKQVGSIDTSKGIITIYSPEKSAWVKVADPTNGNTGWVKANDLGNNRFSFQMMSNPNGEDAYQFFQYGGTEHFSSQQMQTMMQKMQAQQRAAEQEMQHMMHDMFNLQQIWGGFPSFLPTHTTQDQTSQPPATAHPKPTKS